MHMEIRDCLTGLCLLTLLSTHAQQANVNLNP
jgi:hypothetical protein